MQPSLEDHLVVKLFATLFGKLAHQKVNTGAHSPLGLEKEMRIKPEGMNRNSVMHRPRI